MRSLALLAVAGLALAAVPVANATDFCHNGGAILRVGAGPVYLAYVTLDAVPPLIDHGFLWSVWVYAETNGRHDLQRGGESLFGDWDICQDDPDPDMIVF